MTNPWAREVRLAVAPGRVAWISTIWGRRAFTAASFRNAVHGVAHADSSMGACEFDSDSDSEVAGSWAQSPIRESSNRQFLGPDKEKQLGP